jgi:hypothetical protein
MPPPRYLCSQLVTLSWKQGAAIVNLEEIHVGGAVLESEIEVPAGLSAEIHCGSVFFAGKITRVDAHEIGVRIEMEFSPLTPWSLERFRPEHLLDVSAVKDALTEFP